MDDARRRVTAAARDASSHDDQVGHDILNPTSWVDGIDSPLENHIDAETLDERASTQMGPWESRRRGADE